jgi:predicted O-methyltransferase YrrM
MIILSMEEPYMNQAIENYLTSIIPQRNQLFNEMEAYALEHKVPIMDLIGMEALIGMLRLHRPKKILEIGTAIGYSALRISEALPQATIVTLERDEERLQKAREYIKAAKKEAAITILEGDALELFDAVKEHGPYDAIFIDAAKGQYQKFFELYSPLLNEQGMIVTDNVLFKGLVAVSNEEIEQKRLRSLVNKIRNYNKWLMSHNDYHTVILPIGDGVAISVKK